MAQRLLFLYSSCPFENPAVSINNNPLEETKIEKTSNSGNQEALSNLMEIESMMGLTKSQTNPHYGQKFNPREKDPGEPSLADKLRVIRRGMVVLPSSQLRNFESQEKPLDRPPSNQRRSKNDIDSLPISASQEYKLPAEIQKPKEENGVDAQLIECTQGCGRKFNAKALKRHEKICKAVFQEKREAFDSKGQREADEDQELFETRNRRMQEILDHKKAMGNQKWKKQSQDLQASIRAAREYSNSSKQGKKF